MVVSRVFLRGRVKGAIDKNELNISTFVVGDFLLFGLGLGHSGRYRQAEHGYNGSRGGVGECGFYRFHRLSPLVQWSEQPTFRGCPWRLLFACKELACLPWVA